MKTPLNGTQMNTTLNKRKREKKNKENSPIKMRDGWESSFLRLKG